jgi:hypothetical protein
MPFPMVHLLTARRWAMDKPKYLENPDFYLGAILPDAIHMRPGVGREDKRATHLQVWTDGPKAALDSLARRSAAFDVGYVLHILTDYHWVLHVKKTYPQLVRPDGSFIPDIYYPDCDQAEEELYASSAERLGIWKLLVRAATPEDHPLLTGREIDGWRRRVLGYGGMRPSGPAQMITFRAVRSFIDTVQPALTDIPVPSNPI